MKEVCGLSYDFCSSFSVVGVGVELQPSVLPCFAIQLMLLDHLIVFFILLLTSLSCCCCRRCQVLFPFLFCYSFLLLLLLLFLLLLFLFFVVVAAVAVFMFLSFSCFSGMRAAYWILFFFFSINSHFHVSR